MKRIATLIVLATVATITWSMFASAQSDKSIAYPLNFRSWVHVKSGDGDPRGGMSRIYANEKAMEGYRSGQFPDGSVIVYDLIETKARPDGTKAEGARKLVDVMVKDRGRYADTGGWGFEEFKGDSQIERLLDAAGKAACYKCHATQEASGFVFSKLNK
jgi:hypothetical protein